jgi:hypothetical protein
MGFVKLLKSLEEPRYEVMVLPVFYPKPSRLTFRFLQRMMALRLLFGLKEDLNRDTLHPPEKRIRIW